VKSIFSSYSLFSEAGFCGGLSSNLLVNRESKKVFFFIYFIFNFFFSARVFHNLHLRLQVLFLSYFTLLRLLLSQNLSFCEYIPGLSNFLSRFSFFLVFLTGPGVLFLKQLLGGRVSPFLFLKAFLHILLLTWHVLPLTLQ